MRTNDVSTHTQADANRLESVETAAERFGVTPRTVRNWIADGILPGYRVGPRLIRVATSDIDAMVKVIPTGGDPK